MAESFDAYKKWLAIPPEEQPANHYRLLGVPLYEHDLDTIENAADQRMAHVRTFATGKYGDLSQKLLNEISAAKIVLLNAEKKAAYDAALKKRLAPKKSVAKSFRHHGPANRRRRELRWRCRNGSPSILQKPERSFVEDEELVVTLGI